jgi:hypothetical protein
MTTHFISAEVDLHDTAEELHSAIEIELQKHGEPLRWAVTDVDVDRQKAVVEGYVLVEASPATVVNPRPLTVVLIVPTGVGASIGGFAGDALPVARAIAQISDTLITHPNVLNGAQLYWPIPNALYVEGYALDKFAAGCWGLQPVHQNRIGLILDAGIEPDLQLRHLQAVDAARATLGLNITDWVLTDRPLQVELRISQSGASWGTIGNPDSLLRAAEKLINKQE